MRNVTLFFLTIKFHCFFVCVCGFRDLCLFDLEMDLENFYVCAACCSLLMSHKMQLTTRKSNGDIESQ